MTFILSVASGVAPTRLAVFGSDALRIFEMLSGARLLKAIEPTGVGARLAPSSQAGLVLATTKQTTRCRWVVCY